VEPTDCRAILVDRSTNDAKAEAWFSRWEDHFGAVPELVRAWAANVDVQIAYQQAWEGLFLGSVALEPQVLAAVALFSAVLNGSDHVAGIVRRTCHAALGLDADKALERDSAHLRRGLSFVEAWDLGTPLGDADVAALLEEFSDREVVELQLLAGLVGGQGRIARALQLA
jgi:alkylhydroperoxidase family enzyme